MSFVGRFNVIARRVAKEAQQDFVWATNRNQSGARAVDNCLRLHRPGGAAHSKFRFFIYPKTLQSQVALARRYCQRLFAIRHVPNQADSIRPDQSKCALAVRPPPTLDQPPGLLAAFALGASALGASALGASALGASALGASAFGSTPLPVSTAGSGSGCNCVGQASGPT